MGVLSRDDKRLIGTQRRFQKALCLRRQGKSVTMPLKQVVHPRATDPFSRKLGIVNLDHAPTDFLHCVARYRRAKGFRKQLSTKAVTDDWHAALIGIA